MEQAPEVDQLLAEAATWGFLHHLFRFPTQEQWQWLRQDATRQAWRLLIEACGGSDLPDRLPLGADYDAYQHEYISVFEVGAPTPPCPLVESHWNRREPVSAVLYENMLFYKRFGLQLRAGATETADHLRYQLEFAQYLCTMQAQALVRGDETTAAQAAWARAEYLHRHLGWTRSAREALTQGSDRGWPLAWLGLLSSRLACQEHWADLPPMSRTIA